MTLTKDKINYEVYLLICRAATGIIAAVSVCNSDNTATMSKGLYCVGLHVSH
jgi:hypothetical protein